MHAAKIFVPHVFPGEQLRIAEHQSPEADIVTITRTPARPTFRHEFRELPESFFGALEIDAE